MLTSERKLLGAVFGICLLWWIYLFQSSMAVKFDAIAYEQLGEMIYRDGWIEYFRTGPHREPLYPFSVSMSMRLSQLTDISYQQFQKFGQLTLLLVTQLCALALLQKMKVRLWLQAAAVLYIGLSPGLLNAALSLFSEIIIFPSMMMSGVCLAWSWGRIRSGQMREVVIAGISTALIFIFAVIGKAIFQYVFAATMFVIGILVLWSVMIRKEKILKNVIVYFLTVTLLFGGSVIAFMAMNKKYNGRFEFTDRYANLLFGNTYKRTALMNPRLIAAHVASVPGGGFCRKFFSEEECAYAEFTKADEAQAVSLTDLIDIPEDKKNNIILLRVRERILENPVQYVFLTIVEAMKIFFWESCHVGFVNYPVLAERLYRADWFADLLRLSIGVLTFVSVAYCIVFGLRSSSVLFGEDTDSESARLVFFLLLIAGIYSGLYAMFTIVQRYTLPLGPVFVIVVAAAVERFLRGCKR